MHKTLSETGDLSGDQYLNYLKKMGVLYLLVFKIFKTTWNLFNDFRLRFLNVVVIEWDSKGNLLHLNSSNQQSRRNRNVIPFLVQGLTSHNRERINPVSFYYLHIMDYFWELGRADYSLWSWTCTDNGCIFIKQMKASSLFLCSFPLVRLAVPKDQSQVAWTTKH